MKSTVATFTEVMTCKIYRDSRCGGKLVVRTPMGVPVVCNVDAHYTSSKYIRENKSESGCILSYMDCGYCIHQFRNP